MSLEICICVRVPLFARTRMTNVRVCTVHTTRTIGWPYANDRSRQPTNQSTGFIITRWHRAIRADRSLTSVKHVGIIARTRGSFNISISTAASYYPRKSCRRPAYMKTLHESTKPPKRPNFVIMIPTSGNERVTQV